MKKRDRIAIVGGAGYVGSALARHLLKTYTVRVLDVAGLPDNLKGKVEYEKTDVRDYEEVEKALSDCDLAVHTAIIQIPRINDEPRLAYEVNVIGTQNVCKVVDRAPSITGLILASSWHTMGERDITGKVNEEFGFRPDKVEERAKLYALSKIAQESIVRLHDKMSKKVYGIIRMGTILGRGMPKKTAASIFIDRGLRGEPITPYKHSMHRLMLYVDISDVCRAYTSLAKQIINGQLSGKTDKSTCIFNVYYRKPVTVLKLAQIIRELITEDSDGEVSPPINIVDLGQNFPVTLDNKICSRGCNIEVDLSKLSELMPPTELISPKESLRRIICTRFSKIEIPHTVHL